MAEQLADLDVAIGARIRVRRKQARMSQEKLGEALGVTFQQVQKYERGANRVAASTLVRIADALGASPSVLLGEGESAQETQAWSRGLDAEDLAIIDSLRRIPSRRVRSALIALLNQLAASDDEPD